jgi:uncharacterized SAM-binding protein YcdF (DUF218 family)
MVLLVTDVFVLLTQVLLWVVVGLFVWYVLLRALPRVFLGGLVLALLLGVLVLTFFRGSPDTGLLGDIWRIIAVPLSPFGIILILLLIGFSDLVRGKGLSKGSVTLVRIAIPALLLLSLPAVSYFLAQRAEAEAIQIVRPAPAEALPGGARRVIVVLAQGTTQLQLRPRQLGAPGARNQNQGQGQIVPPPEPVPETTFALLTDQPIQLTEKGDVLTYTSQLFQQERGNGPLVVVSAGPRLERDRKEGESRESASEARDAATFLRNRGVTEILEDPNSPTVHNSAVNVRELLQRQNINFGNQVFLVTDAIEMSRAALTFDREFANRGNAGFTVIPRPTDFQTVPPADAIRNRAQGRDLIERNFRLSDMLPTVESLQLSTRVISEYITSIYYFLRGWIRPVRTI